MEPRLRQVTRLVPMRCFVVCVRLIAQKMVLVEGIGRIALSETANILHFLWF
jgi:hypothetical protein